MTDNKHSPFATGLLQATPTQAHMADAKKQCEKQQKQQQARQTKQQKQQQTEQQIAGGTKPFWWLMTMFICALVYLIPEVVFNAALTEVAGGRHSSADDLRAVELFGRTISGVGVTLLLADVLITGRRLASVGRALAYFGLLAVIVWPSVFFGQKWLVDNFIIDASTPAERQQAYLTQVLRSALIEKSIQFEGVDYDPDMPHNSTEKTFLSVFGGLVYADDKLVDDLSQKKRMIMEKFVRDRAMANFNDHYHDYDLFRAQLRTKYQEYSAGSAQFNQAIASSSQRADAHWLEAQNQIKLGWQQYQTGVTAYEARVEARAQKLAPQLYDYFERRNACHDMKKGQRKDRCYARLQSAYDQQIAKYGMAYIPPDDWLIREEVSTAENVGNSVIAGVMTLGLYTAMQAVDAATGGDAGFKDHRLVYTNDVNHYKQVLMVKMAPEFVKQSGGYPLGITSLQDFRLEPLTSTKVSQQFKQQGLTLAANWSIIDRQGFDAAVANKVRQQAESEWRQKMRAKRTDIKPNLSWGEFQRHEDVQQQIAERMGDLYVNPTLADWNNRQFKQQIIEPNIQRKTSEYLTILLAQQLEFADGGAFENTGKSALRAIIIPPISMAISLSLVLLTVLKLPLKLHDLVAAKRGLAASKSQPKPYVKPIISTVLMAMIFVMPISLGGNQYTLKESAMHYFFDQMDRNDSASIAFALKWLLVTQPLVQPLGASIDNSLKITQGFNAVSGPLNRFDLALMPEHVSRPSAASKSKQALPLTVTTNVANAKIAVMNIKPIYHAGMLLAPGRYDIKVSAPGYQSVRQWVDLRADNTQFTLKLKKS